MNTELLALKKTCKHIMIPDLENGEQCLLCGYSPYMENRPPSLTRNELLKHPHFNIKRNKKRRGWKIDNA